MAYRPYPSIDRALAQVRRHQPDAPVLQLPECLNPVVESLAAARRNVRRAAEQNFGMTPGEYRLSTRQ